jgi:hypothetical protein
MFKKLSLASVALVSMATIIPAAADARPHSEYNQSRGYYGNPDYGRGGYYGNSDYSRNGYYGNSYYNRGGYYGRGDYRGRRCNGVTGTILGGAAGALIGRSLDNGYGDRAGGTILGGILGAVAGNAIDRGGCRY